MIGSLLKISLILPYINELFFKSFCRNDSLILYGVRQGSETKAQSRIQRADLWVIDRS